MLFKFFYFLGLFAYLNIIVYEAGTNSVNKHTVLDGDSLVEYVIDDLLDLPKSNVDDIEIQNEKYSLFNTGNYIVTAAVLICFFLYRQILPTLTEHPLYKTKSFCLPGYYSFLFRLKPF